MENSSRRYCLPRGATAAPEIDQTLVRPIDVEILVGDSGKLRQETGWNPRRSVDDIVADLMSANGASRA